MPQSLHLLAPIFLTASLLTLLLALSTTGSPIEVRNSPIILPLARRLNFSNGAFDIVQHDKAHVAALRDYHMHGQHAESIPMLFSEQGQYITALRAGNPPRTYTISLGNGLTIPNYELAVAFTSSNVRCDGILGLRPRYLTANSLINGLGVMYPTFTDCLVSKDAIDENIVDADVGELAFGGPGHTKCTDNIVYTSITDALPSAEFWGFDQSITYGNMDILDETAGIIDTGTAFIEIPCSNRRYFDQQTGLLFTLTANAQIWPRSLNTKLPGGGESSGIYLIITNLDGDGFAIGFATIPFTDATTN
ncbi:aspartic peptidase domain-containing protein [Suillus spraguei]|nr:aspartic peptidase domain-containing protein [Suillus spraguei]